MPRTINDFTDKELADMVRNSLYAKNARFADGPTDARFLLVLAVPYGADDQVDTLTDAIDSFARLLQNDDWQEREIQIYDHQASQHFYSASREELQP